jgi:hypothetical protein
MAGAVSGYFRKVICSTGVPSSSHPLLNLALPFQSRAYATMFAAARVPFSVVMLADPDLIDPQPYEHLGRPHPLNFQETVLTVADTTYTFIHRYNTCPRL